MVLSMLVFVTIHFDLWFVDSVKDTYDWLGVINICVCVLVIGLCFLQSRITAFLASVVNS